MNVIVYAGGELTAVPVLAQRACRASDFAGVAYGPFDEHDGWKWTLLWKLEQAGFEIDHTKANR